MHYKLDRDRLEMSADFSKPILVIWLRSNWFGYTLMACRSCVPHVEFIHKGVILNEIISGQNQYFAKPNKNPRVSRLSLF